MSTEKFVQSAKSATVLAMGTLASATYIASASIDRGQSFARDASIEVEATPSGVTTGNKQLLVYAQVSLDGTNFTSGPVSGTAVTNVLDLYSLGTLPCGDATLHRKTFSLDTLPATRYYKIVVFNDMGIVLTSGNVYTADILDKSTY